MGGGGNGGDYEMPEDPAPAAMPMAVRAVGQAKKAVRRRQRRARGREANILAGRMMAARDTGLTDILGGRA